MKIYSLPNCPNCDTLKGWLRDRGVKFEAALFDVKIHTDLVMKNVFENPPIILMEDGRICGSETMFDGEKLDESLVEWFLSE